MTNNYIKEQINHYKILIGKTLDPTIFTLNPEIQDYVERIEYFQKQCDHRVEGSIKFSVDDQGFCEYCGTPTEHFRELS